MKVTETTLPGVLLIEPRVFGDARGWFIETFHAARYREAGIPADFVQDNVSRSARGVLRGLHFQNPNLQGKLVQVLEGEVFDVAVDIRVGSPSFGRWVGATLSADNHHQLWIPEGFAHGFCVLSEHALFSYKCTAPYDAAADGGIRWDDPDIAVAWPVASPNVSDKDRAAPRLCELSEQRLPRFSAAR
jgi:dTDP-4-dehydrorhamnose 3,5-epimerase